MGGNHRAGLLLCIVFLLWQSKTMSTWTALSGLPVSAMALAPNEGVLVLGQKSPGIDTPARLYLVLYNSDGYREWDYIHHNPYYGYPSGIVRTSPTEYLILARAPWDSVGHACLYLLKLEIKHAIINEWEYCNEKRRFGLSIIMTSDKQCLIAAKELNMKLGTEVAVFVKLNTNGRVTWVQGGNAEYMIRNGTWKVCLVEMQNQNYLATYREAISGITMFFNIDQNGTLIKVHSIDLLRVESLAAAADGGVYIAALHNLAAYTPVAARIIKMNNNESEEWGTALYDLNTGSGLKVIQTEEGKVVSVGTITTNGEPQGILVQLYSNGTIQWIKIFNNWKHLIDVLQAGNGVFFLLSENYPPLDIMASFLCICIIR